MSILPSGRCFATYQGELSTIPELPFLSSISSVTRVKPVPLNQGFDNWVPESEDAPFEVLTPGQVYQLDLSASVTTDLFSLESVSATPLYGDYLSNGYPEGVYPVAGRKNTMKGDSTMMEDLVLAPYVQPPVFPQFMQDLGVDDYINTAYSGRGCLWNWIETCRLLKAGGVGIDIIHCMFNIIRAASQGPQIKIDKAIQLIKDVYNAFIIHDFSSEVDFYLPHNGNSEVFGTYSHGVGTALAANTSTGGQYYYMCPSYAYQDTRPGASSFFKASSTAGETATYLIRGKNLGLIFGTFDGATGNIGSPFTVEIDGQVQFTYDPNGKAFTNGDPFDIMEYYGVSVVGFDFMGLEDIEHTVKVTWTDAGKKILLHSISRILSPAECKQCVYMPENWFSGTLDDLGYNYPVNGSIFNTVKTVVDACSVEILNYFYDKWTQNGWRIRTLKVNYFNPNTELFLDDLIHQATASKTKVLIGVKADLKSSNAKQPVPIYTYEFNPPQ